MKKTLVVFNALIIILLTNSAASAEILKILDSEKYSFINLECAANNTCDLGTFSITVENYMVIVDDEPHYGTRLFAEYETTSVGALTRYGFVSFLRGCKFDSYKKGAEIIREKNIHKWQFDDPVPFVFPEWTIDSTDRDPLYWSAPIENRHTFYLWNEIPKSYKRATEKIYGAEIPKTPRLYVTDRPGTSFLYEDLARNTSLEFRMCIFKTADVPRSGSQDKIDFAAPIHCFSWKSSFIYNHDTGQFEKKESIDPFCLSK